MKILQGYRPLAFRNAEKSMRSFVWRLGITQKNEEDFIFRATLGCEETDNNSEGYGV
jgi:hypothetical protein